MIRKNTTLAAGIATNGSTRIVLADIRVADGRPKIRYQREDGPALNLDAAEPLTLD